MSISNYKAMYVLPPSTKNAILTFREAKQFKL